MWNRRLGCARAGNGNNTSTPVDIRNHAFDSTAYLMPFLTLILKDSANRWTNIIIGIVFTALNVVSVVDYMARQVAYLTLLSIAGTVTSALIVWYAWKWPKQEA